MTIHLAKEVYRFAFDRWDVTIDISNYNTIHRRREAFFSQCKIYKKRFLTDPPEEALEIMWSRTVKAPVECQ